MSDDQTPATKADLREFATKADLREFATKADLREFATKADFSELRATTKADLSEFRAAAKADLREFAGEIREMFRTVFAQLARHSEELTDIRAYIKDKLVTRDEFHARMDAFTGRVSDFDYSSAKQRDRIDDHERRISALETKRS